MKNLRQLHRVNPSHVFILILVLVVSTLSLPQTAFARKIYNLQNEEGFFFISATSGVYTAENPGPWGNLKKEHIPVIELQSRREGLQNLTRLQIDIPHPMVAKPDTAKALNEEDLAAADNFDEPRIQEVYIVDKDGIILGYYQFEENEESASIQTRINGLVNYFEIYIVCSHHGIWKSEYRLKTF